MESEFWPELYIQNYGGEHTYQSIVEERKQSKLQQQASNEDFILKKFIENRKRYDSRKNSREAVASVGESFRYDQSFRVSESSHSRGGETITRGEQSAPRF